MNRLKIVTLVVFLILIIQITNPSTTALADEVGSVDFHPIYTTQVIPGGQPAELFDNGSFFFIADVGNHRVFIVDKDGNSYNSLGAGFSGSSPGQFSFPHGMAQNGTHLYVTDSNNGRVQFFHNSNLSYAGEFSTNLGVPWSVSLGSDYWYVLDSNGGLSKIHKIDYNGTYVSSVSIPTGSSGMYLHNDIFYISFTSTSTLLRKNINLGSLTTYTLKASGQKSVYVDDLYIYISETSNSRLSVYDLSGNYILSFGDFDYGNGAGTFSTPWGISANDTHIFATNGITNGGLLFFQRDSQPILMVNSGEGIILSWDIPIYNLYDPIEYYNIYRGADAQNLTFLTRTTDLSVNDITASPGVEYFYAVTTVSGWGQSNYSNVVSAKINPINPVTITTTETSQSNSTEIIFEPTTVFDTTTEVSEIDRTTTVAGGNQTIYVTTTITESTTPLNTDGLLILPVFFYFLFKRKINH